MDGTAQGIYAARIGQRPDVLIRTDQGPGCAGRDCVDCRQVEPAVYILAARRYTGISQARFHPGRTIPGPHPVYAVEGIHPVEELHGPRADVGVEGDLAIGLHRWHRRRACPGIRSRAYLALPVDDKEPLAVTLHVQVRRHARDWCPKVVYRLAPAPRPQDAFAVPVRRGIIRAGGFVLAQQRRSHHAVKPLEAGRQQDLFNRVGWRRLLDGRRHG